MSAQATQELPQRLDATLRHLQSLAARLDAQGGPILNDVRSNLAEMHKALLAAQAALAKLDTAADRLADLARSDSRLAVSYTHIRAHETVLDLVCRLLLEKKNISHTHTVTLITPTTTTPQRSNYN